MAKVPPLNWLRAFEAVARSSSVTLGARELNVTTSAASQNVKRLEDTLGRALLWREGNRVRLSAAGEKLAADLSAAFALIEEAVAPFAPRKAGVVTILAPRGYGRAVIAPRLATLNAASPHRARLASEAIDPSTIDIEVFRMVDAPRPGASALDVERVIAVCAPAYATALEAGDCVLIHGPWSGPLWARWSLDPLAPRFANVTPISAPAESACLEAARLGIGLALAREHDAADAIARGALISPFEAQIEAPERCWAIARGRGPSVAHVFNWLTQGAAASAAAS